MLTRRWAMCGIAAGAALGAARARAAEDRPVKIGVLADLSSAYADQTGNGVVEAYRMAAEDAGQVLGRPVEVISGDSQIKADVASTIARDWWDNGGVDAIGDLGGTAVALAVMELSHQKKKLALVTSAGSSDITGKFCTPYATQWVFDSYGNATTLGREIAKGGGDSWYFIAADYAFGAALVDDTSAVIVKNGGKVLGVARAPIGTSDFSSLLLQAQASGAKVIGLANAGADVANTIKQANEFGIGRNGAQRLTAVILTDTDVASIGLEPCQGIVFPTAFYWDRTPESRAWSERFMKRIGRMPTMQQAGGYSHAAHYLKAVAAAGTKDADAVAAKMRELPVHDFFAPNGIVRIDGRMVHDMYLAQVKTPAQSKGKWDQFEILATVPGGEAFRPPISACPLVHA